MDVAKLAVDKDTARELYQKYKTHQHYETDMDREIKRAYKLISEGKVIIQAIDAIKRAGLDAAGLPKLALAGATSEWCYLRRERNGSMVMRDTEPSRWSRKKNVFSYHANSFEFAPDTFPFQRWGNTAERQRFSEHKSKTPIIPIHLRPKRGLENYSILWEAEWEPVPTRDPYLLRRIGKSDMWLVCAAWDLTEVERAAMATRIVVN